MISLGGAGCAMPSAFRYDEKKNPSNIANFNRFADIADAAFNPIRQYASGSALVTID
jgi:uncharacterized membrane protein